MSPEQIELRRLAALEMRRSWTHVKRLPSCGAHAISAFARRHPVLAAGAAAGLAMRIATRSRRNAGLDGRPSSVTMAIAALATQFLPDMLQMAGKAVAKRAVEGPENEPTPSRN